MLSALRSRPVTILAALAAASLAAACGDDEHIPDAAVVIDIDAADEPDAALADAALTDAAPAGATAFIAAGDFDSTGVVSTIDLPALTVTPNVLAGVAGPDPFIRRFGDAVYIVNRAAGENITILGGEPLALIDQLATGGGSNPQDVAVAGDKLYVAGLGLDHILVIDTTDRSTDEIDLSDLDAVDDFPDCVSVYVVGTTLYAVCGILDEAFQPRGNGKVVVIDTADDTVIDTFDLDFENPVGQLQPFGDDLLIATVPSYSDFSTGCLDVIHTGVTPSASCLVDNDELDGYGNHYEVDAAGETLWINVAAFDERFNAFGKLIAWSIDDAALGELPLSPPTQVLGDLAVCPGGYLITTETTFGAAGIRVYSTTEELTTEPLDIGAVPNYGNNMTCW